MNPKLIVEQKITAFANKYMVYEAQADGSKGNLLALAQQKRLAFREKVTFYSDEAKTNTVFTFRAEKVMDVHGRYLVEDPEGKLVGMFKKEFKQSLLVSTWSILNKDGEPALTVAESNATLATLRRYGGLVPLVGFVFEIVTSLLKYHFDFKNTASGEAVGQYKKQTLFLDHYLLSMNDDAYKQQDWRTLAAVAVALDALQSR